MLVYCLLHLATVTTQAKVDVEHLSSFDYHKTYSIRGRVGRECERTSVKEHWGGGGGGKWREREGGGGGGRRQADGNHNKEKVR